FGRGREHSMTRIHWLRMTRQNWLDWRAESKKKAGHYLENRIVYCADCEAPRTPAPNAGVLSCSARGSWHWVHVSLASLPPTKNCDETAVQARRRVIERSVERLRTEVFFSPGVSLV